MNRICLSFDLDVLRNIVVEDMDQELCQRQKKKVDSEIDWWTCINEYIYDAYVRITTRDSQHEYNSYNIK